ncbi:MAG: Ig-like domain-containing protein [Peptostreptococcaceae bacterium]
MIYINMSTVISDVVINTNEVYTITGSSEIYNIIVSSNLTTIYLDNVNINVSNKSKASIMIEERSSVTFIIKGSNSLYSGCNYAGVQMNGYCFVSIIGIDNDSILNIYSGTSGAGIGSGFRDDFLGDLIIKSGNINITSTREGAGIGGGNGANGRGGFLGNLTIEGGTINVKSGIGGGAGIGGGDRGDLAGNITINGGIINSSQAEGGIGSGIGGGCDGNLSGNIVINGGEVIATGGDGSAGIGGGFSIQRGGNLSGNVVINGGKTVAYGGLYITTNEGAAGIGGGYSGSFSGDIKLLGGEIIAKGAGNANDLGSGSNGVEDGNVNIKIDHIEVTPNYVELSIGKSQILKTTIVFDPSITANIEQFTKVRYTSEDTSIAVVNENGLVTSVGEGQTNIISTCILDPSKSAICTVYTGSKSIVIGEIDLLINIDKREIEEEDLNSIICYGNNPVITDIYIEENIKSYKDNIDVQECSSQIKANIQYKDTTLYLAIIYSIAILNSNNCTTDLKIYALERSTLSSTLNFCLGENEELDISSFDIFVNPRYTLDKEYSTKYYIFKITGTIELIVKK